MIKTDEKTERVGFKMGGLKDGQEAQD